MAEEEVKKEVKVVAHHPADTNGDGKVSEAEEAMYLEFKMRMSLCRWQRMTCHCRLLCFQASMLTLPR